jgi:arylsulfatase A-like enzyme
MPRIDKLASEGLKLLNFNVEAQCTPRRPALLTGRHAIRSGTPVVPIAGSDGLTRWEKTTARLLSDAGYATGMWGKWHLGSELPDPHHTGRLAAGKQETADQPVLTVQRADRGTHPQEPGEPPSPRSGVDLSRRTEPASLPSGETVDRYDQGSCQAEHRNSGAGDRQADHLAAALKRRKGHTEATDKPAVSQESVDGESGAQEREANPENYIEVPQRWAGLAQ